MTRDEIEKSLKALNHFHFHITDDGAIFTNEWNDYEIIDFALEMVRRHNEECAIIAIEHIGAARHQIAELIREAKP